MKTVMKKMFCLLLVAVLMVGAMPFQAFADELTVTAHLNIGDSVETVSADREEGTWSATVNDIIVQWFGEDPSRFSNATLEKNGSMDYNATLETVIVAGDVIHIRLNEANVPQTVTCPTCSETYTEGTTHTCPTLTCDKCGDTYTKGTTHTCPTLTCDKCGDTYTKGTTHTCPPVLCNTCGDYYTKGTNHTCPLCTAITGCVLTKNHSGEHQCACGLYPQTGSSHNDGCPFDEKAITTPSGSYTVHVWGNLITGETRGERIWLGNIENVSGNALVRDVIGANKEYLKDQIAWKAPDYKWSENYYAEDSSGKLIEIGSNVTVDREDDIIINLYADQKLVVARVHTNKSYHVDMTVQINGFRVGEVVTHDDVLKAVQKHYNVSSMKIYTYTEWEKVVNGKDANKTTSFVVKGGDHDNVYEVYLTGTVKGSSSANSYTADASNPKTGDMIFAPVAVMGLSVSALAVLFFLNKKRAF